MPSIQENSAHAPGKQMERERQIELQELKRVMRESDPPPIGRFGRVRGFVRRVIFER